jgi:hypothetical protein
MADDLGLNSILFGGDSGGGAPSIPSGGFNLSGIEAPSGISPQGLNLGTYGGGGADVNLPGVPTSPDSGGGGWFSNLMGGLGKTLSPVGDFAKSAFPYIGDIAKLGAAGAGIGSSILGMQQGGKANQALDQSMRTQRQIAGAALPEATKLTAAGGEAMLGGPIPPGIQAEVDAWKQKASAEINSYLAHAGIADSTEMAKWQAYIDQQGYLMGQQLSSGLYGQGLQGLGVAGSGAGGLASTAGQMSAGVPQAISGANKALAQLSAQG